MSDPSRPVSDASYFLANGLGASATLTAVANILPPLLSCVAAVMGILWSAICIYESKTMQRYRAHRAERKAKNARPSQSDPGI